MAKNHKQRKSTQARKPRISEVRVDFGRDQALSGMKAADDGTLTFFGESGEAVKPALIEIGTVYSRPKGPKVLTRLRSEASRIQLDPNLALLRFPFVFAVDTNTMQIEGKAVSMTVPCLIRNIEIGRERWNAKLVPQDTFEFHEATVSAERIGWHHIITNIVAHPDIVRPIAVVVDCDLDHLTKFNARTEPILGDYYLPDGLELIYGCGDRGTEEYIANAAIADCDRVASMLLLKVCESGISNGYFPSTEPLYTRYRYWKAPG